MFTGDMMLYMERPIKCGKEQLEQINQFSKVAGYKIDM